MTTFVRAVLTCVLLLATATAQGVHKDSELGFQLRVPKGWRKMPLLDKEKWIVAKYKDKRDYQSKGEMWSSHTPEMKVIVFPKAVTERKAEGPVIKRDEGRIVISPGRRNPYKNFRDYLKANSYGGYYISEEEKLAHRGMDTTFLEVKYEKLTVARRAWAWVIHEQDADWVVYFEALEDWWHKLSPDYKRSFKSFKFIPRTGSILEKHSSTTGGDAEKDDIVIEFGGEKKSPEERAAERKKKRKIGFDRALERTEESLEDGWKIHKSKNFVAVSHVDSKYTKRQLDRAEAVRKWLDKELGWISDAKPGKAILRICSDYEEYNAIAGSSRDAFNFDVEIVTYKDIGKQSWQKDRMNRRVTDIWLSDKNFETWAMPPWLSSGIYSMLGSGYVKSGKLVFKPDEWEATELRNLAREDDLTPPRELMKATSQRFYQMEGSSTQAGAFMRFLVDGPRSKTKGFLETYIEAVEFVMGEEEKREEEERAKRGKKDLTDAEKELEQEARFKARSQSESKRIESAFDIAFGQWSDTDWARFDRAYFDFVK